MTRLLTCGWETGDINESTSTHVNTGGNAITDTIVTSNPTPRSPGTYCLKGVCTQSSNCSAYRQWTLSAAKTEIWTRFGLWMNGSPGGETRFLQFFDSANGLQGMLTWTPSDGLIRVYRGSTSLLGTSSLVMSNNAWHTVEVRWQITSVTVGIIEVWIDGIRWLNLTGVDNTNTANANVQGVALGNSELTLGTGSNTFWAYDDFAINDTSGTINNGQIGEGRVVLLKPNGAGSNTNLTRGGTDSGANWSQCDELPPSLTDYVYSATAGTRDTYALEDVPAGSWTVNCCEVLAYAQNSDAGAGSLGLTVKSGATTNEGTAQNLAITAVYVRQLYETDPNTSAAWTVSAVTALEAGITVR